MLNILLIHPNNAKRKHIAHTIADAGHRVIESHSTTQAREKLSFYTINVIFGDFSLINKPLKQFISSILDLQPHVKLLLLSENDEIPESLGIYQEKIFGIIKPPVSTFDLSVTFKRLEEHITLENEAQSLRGERDIIYRTTDFIAESPAIKSVLQTVNKVAQSDSNVILQGESGTGKELLAGAIHYNSKRAKRPFIKVNCAALPEPLLESELFGHEKGAFTGAESQRIGRFEQANGGSIFLDEIADMSLATQAKVLRAVQEREFERVGGSRTIQVDVRLISATNKDLQREIEQNTFREDLYYRLNVLTIRIPPLRERKEDIAPLVEHFLWKFAREMKKPYREISDEAMEYLLEYSWPGNIREIENCIERAVLLSENEKIQVEDCDIGHRKRDNHGEQEEAIDTPHTTSVSKLREIEREMIVEALDTTQWIQKDASKILGISARSLNYKINKYGITHPHWRRNAPR